MGNRSIPSPRSLEGIFVLDLSRVLAGPWATQTLADLGAEVVKIERPGIGDDTRVWGPPFSKGSDGSSGDAAYFLCANRNKKSVTIDMGKPEGAELLRRLTTQADVLVENFKTGGLAKYGLDYASLHECNPGLVYCSITGFGQDGPLSHRPGYDYMIQAMGGLMSITGQPDESPGGEPMKVGVAVTDLFTGLYAANAILAALLHARKTGEGQHIDMSLFDVQIAMLANQASNWFVSGEAPKRLGNAHPNLAPYQPFETADGTIIVAVGNDHQFRHLCKVCGVTELANDQRFATNAARVAKRNELGRILGQRFKSQATATWIVELEAVGVPCGPINTIGQAIAEPQALFRQLVVQQNRGDLAEPIHTIANPMRLSRTPPIYDLPPPALGSHTMQVLSERLGATKDQLADLRANATI